MKKPGRVSKLCVQWHSINHQSRVGGQPRCPPYMALLLEYNALALLLLEYNALALSVRPKNTQS